MSIARFTFDADDAFPAEGNGVVEVLVDVVVLLTMLLFPLLVDIL